MGSLELYSATELDGREDLYAKVALRANNNVQHERYFRVTFWAFLANFSGLALGIFSGLHFLMSYLHSFENERAMITELYKYEKSFKSSAATGQT